MARKPLTGVFDLDPKWVKARVNLSELGVYALGTMLPDDKTKEEKFETLRIGRTDKRDLGDRISDYKTKAENKLIAKMCDKFEYAYVEGIEEAYENECYLFHEREPLLNKNHPDQPMQSDLDVINDGERLLCPVAGCPHSQPEPEPES